MLLSIPSEVLFVNSTQWHEGSPDVSIKYCRFHIGQAQWRMIYRYIQTPEPHKRDTTDQRVVEHILCPLEYQLSVEKLVYQTGQICYRSNCE